MEITDIVCPLCGSLCDDVRVELENDEVKRIRGACSVGREKLGGHDKTRSPLIRENGELRDTSYDETIDKAAEFLSEARKPLIYGFSSTSCETHKKGIELAEQLGGVIDNTASVCHGPSILAIQTVGLPSCTLGQIKNRAEVVVFWGSNPMQAHANHMRRYSYLAKGFFTAAGKKEKTLIVFDVRETRSARMADIFIQVKPGTDYLILSALRAIIAGEKDVIPDEVAGVPKEKLVETAETMRNARFGILFFGLGLTHSRGQHNNVVNAIQLTEDLNAYTKFVIMPMRGHYNVTGFNQVCTWETGFPFAVDFSRGYAWYNPGETSAVDVLARKECDAALIIASDPASHFPPQCVRHLFEIPVIQIDPYSNPTSETADVIIPSAIVGIEAEGTAYRMDKVPIRMRKFLESPHRSDEEILSDILARVKK